MMNTKQNSTRASGKPELPERETYIRKDGSIAGYSAPKAQHSPLPIGALKPLQRAERALCGDSNDEEHDALFYLVEAYKAQRNHAEKLATDMNTKQNSTTVRATPDKVRRKVEFDYDLDADMSWLDQDEFRQEKPEDHVALQMSVYELNEGEDDWTLVDSLGGIDCLREANDWATGTFYRASDLPEGYLRDLATERLQGEYGAAASLRTISAETALQWKESEVVK